MKIILISLLFLIIGVAIGYNWASNDYDVNEWATSPEETTMENNASTKEQVGNSSSTEASGAVDTVPAENIIVNTSALSEGQKKVLQTFGVDTDKIEVTAEMISCAEIKIGKTRLAEITDGDTPSFSEGLALFNCYQ